jgi:hypothetical protein
MKINVNLTKGVNMGQKPNWPSRTGNPSGQDRGNNPAKGK